MWEIHLHVQNLYPLFSNHRSGNKCTQKKSPPGPNFVQGSNKGDSTTQRITRGAIVAGSSLSL